MEKFKFVFKWVFVFCVLSIWTFFVIGSISGNMIQDENIEVYKIESSNLESFMVEAKEFNIPFYKDLMIGVEKASSSEIIDILFNQDFEIHKQTEEVSDNSCGLRASGDLEVSNILYENTKVKFSLRDSGKGNGIINTGGSDRFSVDFEIVETLAMDSEEISFRAVGDGAWNRVRLNFDEIILTYDKVEEKVYVSGEGDEDFEGEFSGVEVLDGCKSEVKTYFLIEKKGDLQERRSIEEVREILDNYPELIDMHGTLRRLYKDYWWVVLPPSIVS